MVISVPLVTTAQGTVLGEANSNKENGLREQSETSEQVEDTEDQEPEETPEPKESPEQEEAEEQEAEKIHQEVEQKIKRGQLESIEVSPGKENKKNGSLILEQKNGRTTEKQIPASKAPVATLQNVQLGNVSLSVNDNGTVSLVNGGVRIETVYPVVIDPQTKTVAIRTESGVSIISMFPSEILSQLSSADKPTVTDSIQLTNENNTPMYTISGTQKRRFAGIFPVEAPFQTNVSATDGSVISIDEPWYFRNLSFLYSM